MNSLLRIQLLADSGFPTGAFAHSNGLEYAVSEGWVTDQESLFDFTRDVLHHSWITLEAPAILRAYELADAASLIAENQIVAAMRPTSEQRAGQAQVGRSFLKICAESFVELPVLRSMRERLRRDGTENQDILQMPLAWGWTAAQMNIDKGSAVQVFLLMAVRQWAQVAMRLVPLGQSDAYRFVAVMESEIARLSAESIVPGKYRSASPGYDLAAAGHAGMKARYFRS